jgi:hypothetical protein
MDVVIKGDVAWVIGASNGKHENEDPRTRGILVPMDLHTGTVTNPVIVAAKGTSTPERVLRRRPSSARCTRDGVRLRRRLHELPASRPRSTGPRASASGTRVRGPGGLRYGSDVVLDSQGRALVAGIVTEKGTPRGYLSAPVSAARRFSRSLSTGSRPPRPSEALGVLVDAYDRIFVGGYITANGATQARLVLIHG